MARTRNLDPGRDPALHYAFTFRKRHAKRLVYALFVTLVSGGQARAQAQPDAPVPCVGCQAVSIGPGDISVLRRVLSGATVLVRDTGEGLPEIAGGGGRGGIHFTRIPPADDPRLGVDATVFVFDAPADVDPDRAAFDLKQALAA